MLGDITEKVRIRYSSPNNITNLTKHHLINDLLHIN